jgi:hypothetical protein
MQAVLPALFPRAGRRRQAFDVLPCPKQPDFQANLLWLLNIPDLKAGNDER